MNLFLVMSKGQEDLARKPHMHCMIFAMPSLERLDQTQLFAPIKMVNLTAPCQIQTGLLNLLHCAQGEEDMFKYNSDQLSNSCLLDIH